MLLLCDVQELQSVLDQARSALQEREEQLREGEQEREREKEEREKTIRQLTTSLQTKDQLLEVRHTNQHTVHNNTTPHSHRTT